VYEIGWEEGIAVLAGADELFGWEPLRRPSRGLLRRSIVGPVV
jgi:hypothetical protein